MHFVFYKTNDVFAAEEKLLAANFQVEVVPTPVQDKAYCGVCIQVKEADSKKVEALLLGMEYKLA